MTAFHPHSLLGKSEEELKNWKWRIQGHEPRELGEIHAMVINTDPVPYSCHHQSPVFYYSDKASGMVVRFGELRSSLQAAFGWLSVYCFEFWYLWKLGFCSLNTVIMQQVLELLHCLLGHAELRHWKVFIFVSVNLILPFKSSLKCQYTHL